VQLRNPNKVTQTLHNYVSVLERTDPLLTLDVKL